MRLSAKVLGFCAPAFAGLAVLAANGQTSDHLRLMVQVASDQALACAWSPSGGAVLTGSKNGTARLWDVATGDELQAFQAQGAITYVAISSDNRRVLTVANGAVVQLWDEASGKELERFSAPSGKVFGPAGMGSRTAATASEIKKGDKGSKLPPGGGTKIQLWNVETGKEIRHVLLPWLQGVTAVAVLSPDASKLFTGDFDGPQLWDLQTGKLLWRFDSPKEVLLTAVFSLDGRRLVTGSIQGAVRLLDLETGKELQHFSGVYSKDFTGTVNAVALSPDGHQVLTGGNDNTVRVWDVETGKQVQILSGSVKGAPNDAINCVALSPDGTRALAGDNGRTARIWDLRTGKELRQLAGLADPVAALAFAAGGHGILTLGKNGVAWLWDAESGNVVKRSLELASANVRPVIVSADGRRVFMDFRRKERAVWDLETGKRIQSFTGSFLAVDFSPDGRSLLTSSGGPSASLLNVETGEEIQHFTVNPGWRPRFLYPEGDNRDTVAHLALSPDGRRALTSDWEGSTRLWDVKTGKQLRVFKEHTEEPLSVGFSPDSRKLLSENADGSTTLRDVKSGIELQHFGIASRPSFSTDGSRVLLGASVWDVATGREIRNFAAPAGSATLGSLSPDGRMVLMASDDGATTLWDVETGRPLVTLYGFHDGSWAVVDPQGRFDTDQLDGNIALHWVADSVPLRPLPLAAFKDRYYTPHLLARILKGDNLPPPQ